MKNFHVEVTRREKVTWKQKRNSGLSKGLAESLLPFHDEIVVAFHADVQLLFRLLVPQILASLAWANVADDDLVRARAIGVHKSLKPEDLAILCFP